MLDKLYSNSLYIKHRELLLNVLDLSIVTISFFLAYWIRADFRIPDFALLKISVFVIAIIMVWIVYAACFFVFKIQKSLWKYIGPIETVRIGFAVILATIILLIGTFVTDIPRSFYSITVTGGLLSAILMYTVRVSYRLHRRRLLNGSKDNQKAIIIGAGDAGYILLKEIIQNNTFQAEIIGFVDDQKKGNVVAGYKVLGSTTDIPEIVKQYHVKKAFIAIPSANKNELRRMFEICQALKLEIKIMKKGDSLLDEGIDKTNFPIKDISIEDLLGRGEIHLDQLEIQSYITDKVIAVTGAGGSIGSELCRQLSRFNPKEILMIDINENSLYMLEQEFNRLRMHHKLNPSIKIYSYIASIRDYDAIDNIFQSKKPYVVFHAAAHKHVPLMETRPQEAIKNNVFGTNNVIQACIHNKVERFIMISTDKAVNPTNVMGATKRMTEMILQANGKNGVTKMAAVRFGNVLGSNGSVIPIFKKQIEEGGPVTITDKNIIRYFMTIPEAAQLVLQAGYYAEQGEIFVLDMGAPVKILDMAEKMIRMSGYEPYKDIEIKEIGLRPGEKMYEELQLTGEQVSKTKNDLIFKHASMEITIPMIEDKLAVLNDLVHKLNATNEEIKKCIFDLIIRDDNM